MLKIAQKRQREKNESSLSISLKKNLESSETKRTHYITKLLFRKKTS
jgi:hypothetical protein